MNTDVLAHILVAGDWPSAAAAEPAERALALLLAAAAAGRGSLPLTAVVKASGQSAAAVRTALAKCPLVVLDGDVLFLPRYASFRAEVRGFFGPRLGRSGAGKPAAPLATTLVDAVFKAAPSNQDAQQRAAVAGMAGVQAAILTGGPGTGKTTTAAALLVLLKRRHSALTADDVLLAAPTGKAAQRLQASMRSAALRLQLLPGEAEFLGALRPSTLHKALGWTPKPPEQGGPFKRGKGNPLAQTIILVDEASMVDLAMLARLLRAVKDGAQLFLLGDSDQLESVEVGGALAELVGTPQDPRPGIHFLTHNHRARDAPHLIGWAASAKPGSSDDAGAFLAKSAAPGAQEQIRWLPCAGDPLSQADFRATCCQAWEAWRAAFVDMGEDTAAKKWECLGDFQLLCATNAQRIRANAMGCALLWNGATHAQDDLPHGTPIIVTVNHPAFNLSNGDVGLAFGCGPGLPATQAWFPGFEKPVALAELPPFDPAFGLTIHKSQGSEWEHVAIALPRPGDDDDHCCGILTRNLLYTAMTRASRKVTLGGSEAALRNVMR